MTELEELTQWLGCLSTCDACGRVTIEEGSCKRLEAAWDSTGGHPVLEWFQHLIDGPWDDEPRWLQRLGSTARLEILSDLVMRFEEYCQTGSLSIPRELNTLDAATGLREIKVPRARVPIFESNAEYQSTRCTHGFYKNQQKTPQHQIRKGLAIMRADNDR